MLANHLMAISAEYFNGWIFDERTGTPRRTTCKLTRVNAEKTFPGAKPYHRQAPDGHVLISMKGFEQWVERGRA